jgi:hypothetical protein
LSSPTLRPFASHSPIFFGAEQMRGHGWCSHLPHVSPRARATVVERGGWRDR